MSKNNNTIIQQSLAKLKTYGKQLYDEGQKKVKYGQIYIDIADYGNTLMNFNPDLKFGDEIYTTINNLIPQGQSDYPDTEIEPVYSSTSGSIVSVMIRAFDPKLVAVDHDDEYVYVSEYNKLTELQKRLINKDKVIRLMHQFKLDEKFFGEKSPLEHFKIAHSAFEAPITRTNPVSSSLIPMRSCLTSSIEKLLKERPDQEKASNNSDKIISIGKYLCKPSIPFATIDTLAHRYSLIIMKELSPAKTGEMSRDEWLRLLNNSTSFLQDFLTILDPKKMRTNR